jgi:Beta-lactamase
MIATVASQFQRATPESQGVPSSAILQFVAVESQIHQLHSFMLLRHSKAIAEGWWSPYQRERLHMLYSLSKSFTSTAVGLAVAEGQCRQQIISFQIGIIRQYLVKRHAQTL